MALTVPINELNDCIVANVIDLAMYMCNLCKFYIIISCFELTKRGAGDLAGLYQLNAVSLMKHFTYLGQVD